MVYCLTVRKNAEAYRRIMIKIQLLNVSAVYLSLSLSDTYLNFRAKEKKLLQL